MNPRDKVILVTGASSGIGLATARALVRSGARVALAARSEDKLDAAVRELKATGGDALALPMDVCCAESVERGVARLLDQWGRIDVAINNAGNGGRLALWATSDPASLREMFDVHVFGMERVSRAVLAGMLEQGSGTIVNIASTVAWVPMPAAAAYSSAKAAVVAFSESLRGELEGTGVEVMVFGPPHTSTEAGELWPLEGPRVHTPEWVADELIRCLRREPRRFLAGASNRLLLFMQRLHPDLALNMMKGIGLRAARKAGVNP